MQRARPNTLSILERAQGQLSGKRFGKGTTKQSQNITNDVDEEDELKAYLSQLQQRTTQQRTTQQLKDSGGSESDESYHPNNSAFLKSGSQFLKSSRVTKDSPVKNFPNTLRNDGKSWTAGETQRISNNDMENEESSDISDISDPVSFKKSFEPNPNSTRFLKEKPKAQDIDSKQSPKKAAFNKPPLKTSTPSRGVKSSAFERIMSNLGSDEDDVESLIKTIESSPRSPDATDKVAIGREPTPLALSPHPADKDSPREDIVNKILSQEESEIISSIASDSSRELPKINVLQAADLEPALEPIKVDDMSKETFSRIFTKTNKQKESTTIQIESDVETQEVQSDIDTEIHTGTESVKEHSDEETEADVQSYSSVESQHSRKSSPVKSESIGSVSTTSRETTKSQRSQTVTESNSVSSSYTDDFNSETNHSKSKSVSSSGTLTPRQSATPSPRHPVKPKHFEKPSPTPSPTPRRSRVQRVYLKDTGVQTSNIQDHDHWLYDHTSQGRHVDVSSLLEQHRSSFIPPETLHNVAVSSVDSTSLLLHQTLKLQFQQTQKSINKMLQVHQSLLESIQGDHAYTTLKDTQSYIQRHREFKD